jgi:hypothetical protein
LFFGAFLSTEESLLDLNFGINSIILDSSISSDDVNSEIVRNKKTRTNSIINTLTSLDKN